MLRLGFVPLHALMNADGDLIWPEDVDTLSVHALMLRAACYVAGPEYKRHPADMTGHESEPMHMTAEDAMEAVSVVATHQLQSNDFDTARVVHRCSMNSTMATR